ncbi:MAG: Asp-tRNA(Asn)/Glu-tRNA(Gln) amidotransferase subunit GatC [Candidatus Roizmanbacteria bacterium]|nr:Asp-tRNA(Asn)/Glu-tRNA(Gln) amidotransferase subunit GatC [Candidatus Roizmanbacteria bacterium]
MTREHKQLSKKDIEYLAGLVKINLSESEISKLQLQLNDILTYVEKLNEITTDTIQGTSHTVTFDTVLGADDPKKAQCIKDLKGLHITPGKKAYFSVSKMLAP